MSNNETNSLSFIDRDLDFASKNANINKNDKMDKLVIGGDFIKCKNVHICLMPHALIRVSHKDMLRLFNVLRLFICLNFLNINSILRELRMGVEVGKK